MKSISSTSLATLAGGFYGGNIYNFGSMVMVFRYR